MKLDIFELERWYGKSTKKVEIDISGSGIDALRLDKVLEICGEDLSYLSKTRLDYGDSQGDISLREEVAKLHSAKPSAVLITTGASEALFIVLSALIKRMDNIIVEYPFYQPLDSFIASMGGSIKRWKLTMRNKYLPDINRLVNIIDKNTKAILINHPHNPTGSSLSLSLLEKIVEIAHAHDAVVISDEVSREIAIDDGTPLPTATSLSDSAVSIGSISKAYGLPGIRVGWIVGEHRLIEKYRTIKEHISVCNSPISQHLALLVMRNSKRLLSENIKTVRRNLSTADMWVKKNSEWCSWIKPTGGACGFPMYRLGVPSYTFCKSILKEEGILLVPGKVFGVEFHFRLGLGGDHESLNIGLKMIEKYVKSQLARE